MPIYSLQELRAIAPPELQNADPAVLINEYSKANSLDPMQVAGYFGFNNSGSMSSNRIGAGIDNYQAGLYGLGGAAARAVGANDVGGWMDQRREANELQANTSLARAKQLGAVESWDDVHGVGDFANYAGGLAAQSLPYAGEALVGGIAARGLATGTRAALAAARTPEEIAAASRALGAYETAGGVAASYPSSVGDILGNQRQAGGEDFGTALVGGIPYAALNAFGVEGMTARGLRPFVAGEGRLARMATGAASTALGEGLGETGQEMANQFFGRMAVNPSETLFSDDAMNRYKESFIGGATLGGLMGGAGGFRGPRTVDDGQFDMTRPGGETAPQGPAPRLGYSPLAGTPIVFPDGSVTLGSEQELQKRYGTGMPAAAAPDMAAGEAAPVPKAPSIADLDAVDQGLTDVGIPLANGKKTRENQRAFYQAALDSGIPLDSDLLVPFWKHVGENKFGDKTKVALQNAIVAHKKGQANVSTSSAPVAATGTGNAGPSPVADGSVGTGGPVAPVDGGGSGVAPAAGAAAPQVSPVGDTGVQQTTVVSTQQKADPFQVSDEQGAPLEEAKDDPETTIKQIFGERDGSAIIDSFVNKLTAAQIAEKHGLSRSRVAQLVGDGKLGQKFRDDKVAAAKAKYGWTDEHVANMMAALVEPQVATGEEAGSEYDSGATTGNNIEEDFYANGDITGERTSTLGEAGFSTISSEGGSTGYTDKIAKGERKGATPQQLASSLTQQWFETQEAADALRERIDNARERGRDTLANNQGKQTLEEAEAEYEAMLARAQGYQERAAALLKQAKGIVSKDTAKTDAELAGEAWDFVAEENPDAPKWASLTKDQRQDFIDYGEQNWTRDDVLTEMAKLDKSSKLEGPAQDVMEAVSSNGTEIRDADVEVDKQLRGKSFKEAAQWAIENARNEFERAVMRSVVARLKDLSRRGVEFRFFMTGEGKQLTGGASGLTVSTPAGLGEPLRVDVVLNGAHTGDRSGANYVTLAHELIHAATQAQLKFAPDGSLARQFHEFYSELAKGVRERQAAGNPHGWEKRFWKGANNSLKDADELLAWGLTDKGFQKYLNDIEVTPKQTLWDRFVSLVSKALGIPVRANSALAKLMQLSEGLLEENLNPYVAEANSQYQSLGLQPNTTQWPNWTLNSSLGAPVWVDGDLALYRGTSTNGGTLYVPGMRSGDTSRTAQVDVKDFGGNQIPAASLAKMRAAADALRRETHALQNANVTPKAVQQPVSNLTRVLKVAGSKVLNTVMFSQDLFNRAADMGITSAKELGSLYQKRAAMTGEIERKVIRIEQMFNNIPQAKRAAANAFVREMRFAKAWGFVPEWRTKAKMDVDLSAKFDELPAETQAWVKAVFKHGDEMRTLKQDAVRNAFNSVYDARILDAKNANDADKVAKLEKEKASELARFKRLFDADENNPYAPVRRFGNWVVVGKSNEYLDAEEAGDKKKMAELEADADHYFVDFRESYGEALKLSQDLQDSGLNSGEPREKEDARNDMYGGLMQAFDKLRGNIESEMGNTTDAAEKKALRAAREVVVDLYLRSLADTSARKSELRFKGIAGDIDMLRSFSSQGRADAHFLAAATYNPQMTETITKMREQKKTAGSATQKTMAFNEIMARHEQSMKYQDGGLYSLAGNASGVTSAWMLATSPMYYLQNLTQPAVISVPYMTGNHDYSSVWGQLLRAYHQMGPLVTSGKSGQGFDFSKVPEDVRDAILELVNRGRIDIGMDTELGKVKLEGDTLASKAANRTSQFFRTLAQKAEAINRVSTAMAAYRLEFKKTGDAQAALEYADEVLDKTHGDYTAANAPRAFNTPMGKVALQFRKFQLIQLTLLVKLTHDAFKGAKPAERAAARKMLAFTLGHTGVLAGVVGMPGFAAASFIINKLADLFGDDDEPFNLENELRKALGDGDMARIVMRGLPMGAGVDISGKVGMGNALSILPYSDMDMTRAGFNEVATGLTLGATGGLGARVWESLGKIKDGDYYRGLAGLMPKGLADAYRSAYEFNNGLLRTNGDTLVSKDEIGTFDTFAKAIGLTTAKESERKFDAQVVYDTKEAFEKRTNQIKNQYVQARRNGDGEAASKAIASWQNLQKSRREAGFTVQPASTLLKAPMEQMKRDRNVSNGVQYDKNSRRMVLAQTAD